MTPQFISSLTFDDLTGKPKFNKDIQKIYFACLISSINTFYMDDIIKITISTKDILNLPYNINFPLNINQTSYQNINDIIL